MSINHTRQREAQSRGVLGARVQAGSPRTRRVANWWGAGARVVAPVDMMCAIDIRGMEGAGGAGRTYVYISHAHSHKIWHYLMPSAYVTVRPCQTHAQPPNWTRRLGHACPRVVKFDLFIGSSPQMGLTLGSPVYVPRIP
eukprot:scaffold15422_cov107-Isochrysis_galbana.AAC.2